MQTHCLGKRAFNAASSCSDTISSSNLHTQGANEAVAAAALLVTSSKGAISISEFKELTNLTRKFSVPLLEYFDKIKFTYRCGDLRKINE